MRRQNQVDIKSIAHSLVSGKDAGHQDEMRSSALLNKFLNGYSETFINILKKSVKHCHPSAQTHTHKGLPSWKVFIYIVIDETNKNIRLKKLEQRD